MLLPEIALSSQWLERFERRFGVAPAVWHSDLTSRVRRITWRAVAEGAAPVVVGARSALFLPFPDLGLRRGRRGARDRVQAGGGRRLPRPRHGGGAGAVLRGAGGAGLGDAQPGDGGQCRGRPLPAICICRPGMAARCCRGSRRSTCARTPPERGHFLAPPLIAAIRDTLARGEQAMLFLNRRGYAPLTLCRHCGHRMQCPNCTAWLVEHRARARAAMPPLRPRRADPGRMPGLRGGEQPDRRRPGRGAHHRGSRRAVPRRAAPGDGERHAARPARRRRGGARDRGARGRPDHRHADRRQGLALSRI